MKRPYNPMYDCNDPNNSTIDPNSIVSIITLTPAGKIKFSQRPIDPATLQLATNGTKLTTKWLLHAYKEQHLVDEMIKEFSPKVQHKFNKIVSAGTVDMFGFVRVMKKDNGTVLAINLDYYCFI